MKLKRAREVLLFRLEQLWWQVERSPKLRAAMPDWQKMIGTLRRYAEVAQQRECMEIDQAIRLMQEGRYSLWDVHKIRGLQIVYV